MSAFGGKTGITIALRNVRLKATSDTRLRGISQSPSEAIHATARFHKVIAAGGTRMLAAQYTTLTMLVIGYRGKRSSPSDDWLLQGQVALRASRASAIKFWSSLAGRFSMYCITICTACSVVDVLGAHTPLPAKTSPSIIPQQRPRCKAGPTNARQSGMMYWAVEIVSCCARAISPASVPAKAAATPKNATMSRRLMFLPHSDKKSLVIEIITRAIVAIIQSPSKLSE